MGCRGSAQRAYGGGINAAKDRSREFAAGGGRKPASCSLPREEARDQARDFLDRFPKGAWLPSGHQVADLGGVGEGGKGRERSAGSPAVVRRFAAAVTFSWQLWWPFSCRRFYVEPLMYWFLLISSKTSWRFFWLSFLM